MERWMVETIKDLQLLQQRKMAVEGLRIRIRRLDNDAASLSGRSFGTAPMKGGGNRQEAWLCALVDSKRKLEQEREAMQALVEHTEKALNSLPEKECAVLEVMYCKGMSRGEAVRKLEQELYVSEATVYRLREKALTKLAMMMGHL